MSISLLLKEMKFKVYYDVVIFWPKFDDGNIIIFILVMCSISAQRWYRIENKRKLYVLILTNIKLRHSILPNRENSADEVDFDHATYKVLSILSCIVEVKKEKSLSHSDLFRWYGKEMKLFLKVSDFSH